MKKFAAWLRLRFDNSTPDGWNLTVCLIIAGLGLAGFAGVLQGVRETDTIAGFDQWLGQAIISHRTDMLTAVMEVFTGLAGTKGVLLLLGLTGVLLFKRPYRQLPLVLAAATAVELLIVLSVKLLVARPRPDLAIQIVHETSFSFPSGHTMAAVVVYGLLAYFLGRTITGGKRWLVMGAWLGFATGVAVSRIYLGIHFPSDTVASACLGAAGLSLGLAWTHHRSAELNPQSFDAYARRRLFLALAVTLIVVIWWRPLFI